MKRNDKITLKIKELNEDGKGVGFLYGQKVIVPNTLENETVKATVTSSYYSETTAKVDEVLEANAHRVLPKCPYIEICGGCNLQHIDYAEQLNFKKQIVKTALKEFSNIKVEDTVGVYYPYEYRNKIHFAIAKKAGKVIVGFFEEGSKQIVDIPNCSLYDTWAQKLYAILKEYLKISKIEPYDIDEQKGLLRYVTARYLDNQIIVTMVTTKKLLPESKTLYELLKKEFKKISLYLNVNTRTDSFVYGEEFIHLYGEQALVAKIMGVEVELFPTSFLQINTPMMTKIYKKVIELAGVSKNSVILDLFSGIGITSVLFASLGAQVISVELEKSAVIEARRLIKKNGFMGQVKALEGDCNKIVKELMKELPAEKEKIIFVDPPRKGLEKTASVLASSGAQKIIYLSCNPFSLSEDLKTLTKNYKIKTIIPYDMFPQTKHVETLLELELI
ncbi:MAG: 23S rRNA (uracil(1939)-C(5))-methyltransferase RlmD [Spirochaetales bacterium]